MKNIYKILAAILVLSACQKEQEKFEEPYPAGKNPLGIVMDNSQEPNPASGLPGTEVKVKAIGLTLYADQLVVRFNGEQAEINEITAEGFTVKVPDYASTGVISVSVGDAVVFGPNFSVTGRLNPDPTFRAVNGANRDVSRALQLSDGKYIFVGDFTNYDNKGIVKPINRIVRTFSDGSYDASLRSGKGANGYLMDINMVNDKLFISGAFNGYDQRTENISNLAMLHTNGSIDTIGIKTFRRPDQTDTTKYFPRFNGGTDGSISRVYPHQGKLLITGNFRYYLSRQYDKPNRYETRDTVIVDSTEFRHVARLNLDGTLDKTFRFNEATNQGFSGGNGNVSTYMHNEGPNKDKLVVFGSFTRFDDQAAGYIVRLKENGTIDESFKSGTGANKQIFSLTFNPVTRKYLITGIFTSYDGQPAVGMALLNEDGSLDPSFTARPLDVGTFGLAQQLSDGLIVVDGSFQKYDNITRNGFMVLNPDGSLAVGYNATGVFTGGLSNIIETKSEDNKRALLLIGSFYRFNNQPVNSITRLVIN